MSWCILCMNCQHCSKWIQLRALKEAKGVTKVDFDWEVRPCGLLKAASVTQTPGGSYLKSERKLVCLQGLQLWLGRLLRRLWLLAWSFWPLSIQPDAMYVSTKTVLTVVTPLRTGGRTFSAESTEVLVATMGTWQIQPSDSSILHFSKTSSDKVQ